MYWVLIGCNIELHMKLGFCFLGYTLSHSNLFSLALWQAIFVGHNHGLDWCCPFEKLWLCFARHTGYGGYGNWARGARIVEITQQPFSIKSWIRMEDGSVHSELVLSP